jgi:hypothetical protein
MPGLINNPTRFLSFSCAEWEKMYPELILNSGSCKEIEIVFKENNEHDT